MVGNAGITVVGLSGATGLLFHSGTKHCRGPMAPWRRPTILGTLPTYTLWRLQHVTLTGNRLVGSLRVCVAALACRCSLHPIFPIALLASDQPCSLGVQAYKQPRVETKRETKGATAMGAADGGVL